MLNKEEQRKINIKTRFRTKKTMAGCILVSLHTIQCNGTSLTPTIFMFVFRLFPRWNKSLYLLDMNAMIDLSKYFFVAFT